jgi:hypothetical protein
MEFPFASEQWSYGDGSIRDGDTVCEPVIAAVMHDLVRKRSRDRGLA